METLMHKKNCACFLWNFHQFMLLLLCYRTSFYRYRYVGTRTPVQSFHRLRADSNYL
jgi:hypothetical protein